MSLEGKYNKLYSENETTFAAGKPDAIVEDIIKFRPSGSVLELGAGEGRNALFLAGNGFQVTAQDISTVGLDKINKLAKAKNLNINTELKDVSAIDLGDNFDVFVCTFVLHHLKREEALAVIAQMQAHTNIDGLNVISAFTEDGDFYRNNPDTDNFYLKAEELKALYDTWEILEYSENEEQAFAKNEDGVPMVNVVARLLVKKIK